MRKCLLLNATYEIISFISEKRAIKLLFKKNQDGKNKVEVIANWDHFLYKDIKNPSILRLTNHVRRNFFNANFSRKALVKRDKSTCQFCNKKLSASNITIDHVLPKSKGGGTTFINCVVACQSCNNKKADRTPEEAGMVLLKRPVHPSFSSTNNHNYGDVQDYWHDEWENFLGY